MQKVASLNTCCDIACLTFQLPHITTGSFQSHRCQLTTGSLQSLQRLKERNKPSVRWKSFAFHKLMWGHFQVGWASGLQLVFFWYNINNQTYVWIVRLKMKWRFRFSKVKWLHLTGEVDKSVWFSCQFFRIYNSKKTLKSVNFWQSYSKNEKVDVFGTQCRPITNSISTFASKISALSVIFHDSEFYFFEFVSIF